jgi:hypothetical protein
MRTKKDVRKYSFAYGMQTPGARKAILGLIALFILILGITLAEPSLIQAFDDLIPLVKNNPELFYIFNSLCILLALYIGFLRKR